MSEKYNKIECYYDFIQYCLKKLGAPVINIEVDDAQIIDRVSDALQYYLDRDLESVMNCYWIHKVTKEEVEQGYLNVPPDVIDVMEIRTKPNQQLSSGTVGFDGLDSPEYEYWDFYWKGNGQGPQIFDNSMIYYEMTMQHISTIRNVFSVMTDFMYRPIDYKLAIYGKLNENQIIVMYGTKRLDPETNDSVWNSKFLKEYATALIGVQWGTNISKYGNVPSVGGLTLNGDEILARYQEEKTALEERHKLEHEEPPFIFWG